MESIKDARLPANVISSDVIEKLLTPPLETEPTLLADLVALRQRLEGVLAQTAADRRNSLVRRGRRYGRRR